MNGCTSSIPEEFQGNKTAHFWLTIDEVKLQEQDSDFYNKFYIQQRHAIFESLMAIIENRLFQLGLKSNLEKDANDGFHITINGIKALEPLLEIIVEDSRLTFHCSINMETLETLYKRMDDATDTGIKNVFILDDVFLRGYA